MKSKYNWKKIDKYIIDHPELTNGQIGKRFGAALSTISWRRCGLGVKKMEMEYWTDVQIKWLKKLYQHVGDLEISMIFNEAYPKEKGWTLKHIEKKRNYLGLKRSKEQLRSIKSRNKLFGAWMVGSKHTWETRGRMENGEVRTWKGRQYIKSDDRVISYSRFIWEQNKGPIPEGMNVVRRDLLGPAAIENLELITNRELGARNSGSRYPLEIKNAIRSLKKLNQLINEK